MNWKQYKADYPEQAEAIVTQLGYDPESLQDTDANAVLESCLAMAQEGECTVKKIKDDFFKTASEQSQAYDYSDLFEDLKEKSATEAKAREIDERLTTAYIKRMWLKELRIKRRKENDEYMKQLLDRFPAIEKDYYADVPIRSFIDRCYDLDKFKGDVEAVDRLKVDNEAKGELIAWLLKNKTSRDIYEGTFTYSDENFDKLFADYEGIANFDIDEKALKQYRAIRLKYENDEVKEANQWLEMLLLKQMAQNIKWKEAVTDKEESECSDIVLKKTIDAYMSLIDSGLLRIVMNDSGSKSNTMALNLMSTTYSSIELSRKLMPKLVKEAETAE